MQVDNLRVLDRFGLIVCAPRQLCIHCLRASIVSAGALPCPVHLATVLFALLCFAQFEVSVTAFALLNVILFHH
jgi:hypothetical protein